MIFLPVSSHPPSYMDTGNAALTPKSEKLGILFPCPTSLPGHHCCPVHTTLKLSLSCLFC